jgi:hypothetical protein
MIIAIPITLLLLYMAKYYTLKHEYQELHHEYSILSIKYWQNTKENEENNEKE